MIETLIVFGTIYGLGVASFYFGAIIGMDLFQEIIIDCYKKK